MNAVRQALSFAALCLAVPALGCAGQDLTTGADPAFDTDTEPTESAESELHTSCRAVFATDGKNYYGPSPNVARELAASLGPAFVTDGVATIPGVLRATASTSPYTYAATLELGAWSTVSTTTWNGGSGADGDLVLRVQGSATRNAKTYRAAKAIFDAMTQVPEVTENGARVRRSPLGAVTCAQYPDHIQCALGPVGHIEERSTCPK